MFITEAEGWGGVTMAGAHVWTTISMIPYEHLRSAGQLVLKCKIGGTVLHLFNEHDQLCKSAAYVLQADL